MGQTTAGATAGAGGSVDGTFAGVLMSTLVQVVDVHAHSATK